MDQIETSVRAEIRDFIRKRLARDERQRGLKDSDDLITSGLVDSLGILHLVAFIEESFGIHVRDEDIVPENFESVDSLVGFITRSQKES